MVLLVLFGTGLFGIVLCVGTCLAGGSDRGLAWLLNKGVRIARFAVPLLLLFLLLCATYDVDALAAGLLDKLLENVRSLASGHVSFFSSD